MKKKITTSLAASVIAAAGILPTSAAPSDYLPQAGSGVTMQTVTFQNRDVRMTGNLYLPAHFDRTKTYPAISIAHPWGGVKEQTAGIYARKLAENGFVTLAYDASHYGESGGLPRYEENPAERVGDIYSVIDYLSNQPYVDANRIGALGICAGGGYTIAAAETDPRIQAVAAVSAYDVGDASRNGLRNVWPVDRKSVLAEAARQRTLEAAGAAPRIDKLLPTETPPADAPQFVRNAYDYYNTERGRHPNATGNFHFTSNIELMSFFPFAQIDAISPRPLLLIAGTNAQSRYFSEDAYRLAGQPKELFLVDSATHFDLYDKPEYVDPAVEKLTQFFQHALGH